MDNKNDRPNSSASESKTREKKIITKDYVKQLPLSFKSLIDTMENVFDMLQDRGFASLKDKTVVIALGSTGVGKSTMLNSLTFGPQALEMKKIEKPATSQTGSKKKKNKNSKTIVNFVIDFKE